MSLPVAGYNEKIAEAEVLQFEATNIPVSTTLPKVELRNGVYGSANNWEGYATSAEWLEALRAARAEYEGYADSAIETYKNYITEEEIAALKELENNALMAHSLNNLEECKAALEEKVISIANRAPRSASATYSGNWSGAFADFMRAGVIHYGGNKYTYYSQSVLPGYGLNIPGRHLDGGFVKDGDGYIVVASDKPKGSVVDTPFGAGKVYDRGTSGNHYDIYVQ